MCVAIQILRKFCQVEMKIVHVVEAFGGGTLNAVVLLANQQARELHAVTVIHSMRPDTPEAYVALFDARVSLVPLAIPQGLNPLKDLSASRVLRKALKSQAPDLIHLHSSKAGAVGRLAALGLAVPVVYSPHGFSFNRQDVPEWKRRVFWGLEWMLGRLPGHLMACSSDEATAARAFSPTTRIFNAVDVPTLVAEACHGRSAIKRRPGQPTLVIAMAGRITAARNPEGFSEVARQVLAKRKDVAFYWLGDGERELLDPAIRITGWLTKADLLASLRNIDIYFHPSRWDGLPFAVLEAMSQGLPVVASTAGGNKDAVSPGRTGFLVDSPGEQALALLALLDNAQRRAAYGAAGQARVETYFCLAAYFQQVQSLYTTLCSKKA